MSPGLSLITSVFVCTHPAWSVGVCGFCLSCLGFFIAGIESISISIYFYRGGLELVFDLFLFPLIFKLIYVYFLKFVFHFFDRICCFIFCWVVFGIFKKFFLLSLFWRFIVSVLMWVVVSTGSSMSIGPNLLDNGIGSFISVFCLVWIFSSLLWGFSLILVMCVTFIWNFWNVFLDCLFCDHFCYFY